MRPSGLSLGSNRPRGTGYNTGTVAHIYWEPRNLLADPRLRQLLPQDDDQATAGECAPPMDVIETAAGIEVLLDLPGVARAAVAVAVSDGTLIVAGRKLPKACEHHGAAFHLAERSFGRFVRAIRLTGPFDGGQARASLSAGELRIVLPRIEERRGRDIRIDITTS